MIAAAKAETAAAAHAGADDVIVPLNIWMEYADPKQRKGKGNNIIDPSNKSTLSKKIRQIKLQTIKTLSATGSINAPKLDDNL